MLSIVICVGIVMSIIHSTFNRVNTSYTVIGNSSESEKKISVLLLSRGGRPFRYELYQELAKLDFDEVLSIEVGSRSHFDLEKESLEHNFLRFLILKDEVTIGEMINIGFSELKTPNVLVLWDDMFISSKQISFRLLEKIMERDILCTVPLFINSEKEEIPTLMTPLFANEMLKVVPYNESGTEKTLYPYQFTGIYNRGRFIQLGGFDIDIRNQYWQNLDFGLRAHMWGEEILSHRSFSLVHRNSENLIDDITPDSDYMLYILKNLSVNIKKGVGYLPVKRFFSFYEKSGTSFFEALKVFRSVKRWVSINKYRFKSSAPEITRGWDL